MRKELLRQLKEIHKNNQQIRIYDFNGWNVHIKNINKNISIWIESSDINCNMVDGENNNFYEIYVYRGLQDDLRENEFIKEYYSNDIYDYKSAIKLINEIIM
jgi:hypothetical protein